jgi:hypothetical protein
MAPMNGMYVAMVVFVLLTARAPVFAQFEQIVVDDSRPIYKAMGIVEALCKCVIGPDHDKFAYQIGLRDCLTVGGRRAGLKTAHLAVKLCARARQWLSRVQAQDGGFRLTIVPESISVSYNAPMLDHHVFFTGEPVVVAVKLMNHTREEFIPRDKPPLADHIIRTAEARHTPDAGGASLPVVTWSRVGLPRHHLDGTSPIPPRNYAEMRWFLTSEPIGGSLSPGIYDVSVRYRLRPDHELSGKVVVEVREPKTRADQLDALLHSAIRARWDGQFSEAERLLNQLLAVNQVSAVAYTQLAAVFAATRNCAAARHAIDQALAIITSGADSEHVRFRTSYSLDDWVSGLRQSRSSCK